MATLVLTALGDDQSGLVETLAAAVAEHGGSWERSQMAQLAGKFAGIVVVTVPDGAVAGLSTSLEEIEHQGLLDITIGSGGDGRAASAASDGQGRGIHLELVGRDRPGIIREISAALAAHGVSIEELETEVSSAPMSAEELFEARLELRAPAAADLDRLATSLEAIANELMVDLEFNRPS